MVRMHWGMSSINTSIKSKNFMFILSTSIFLYTGTNILPFEAMIRYVISHLQEKAKRQGII